MAATYFSSSSSGEVVPERLGDEIIFIQQHQHALRTSPALDLSNEVRSPLQMGLSPINNLIICQALAVLLGPKASGVAGATGLANILPPEQPQPTGFIALPLPVELPAAVFLGAGSEDGDRDVFWGILYPPPLPN